MVSGDNQETIVLKGIISFVIDSLVLENLPHMSSIKLKWTLARLIICK